MISYTGTLIVMHATVMNIFSKQYPDKQPKPIILSMTGVILMQNCNVIKETRIILDTLSTDSAKILTILRT